MAYSSVRLRPGIDLEQSPALNETGWASCNLVRFYNGLPQPIGGWLHLTSTPLVGTCRALHAWADLLGNPYMACGTNQRLEIFVGGQLYDITPIRATTNFAPGFTTTISTPTVKITDTANSAEVGDWVNILVPVSIGGIVIQGFYQVASIVDVNNYTITAASNATSSVTNGGAVPKYTTITSQSNVTVTLNNHGYLAGAVYTNYVSTTVGGITFGAYQPYSVATVTDANNFVINSGTAASSSTNGFENGGDARILYLIASGPVTNLSLTGYGAGPYGAGPFGTGSASGAIFDPMRLWFLSNFGQDLVANYNGSTLYFWAPPYTFGSTAIPITGTDVPQTVNVSFVAAPQQMVIVLGSDPVGGGAQDPNLVRWCDVGDFTDWLPTSANQAGSYRIPSGSMLVGGLTGPSYVVLWTDVDMYLMQYLGAPLVWGFTRVASGCGLIAPNAAGTYESLTLWMGKDNFFVFDGNSVRPLPCTVWDFVFGQAGTGASLLNSSQIYQTFCAVNSYFAEVTWYFLSTGTTVPDSYVTYNIRENAWTYGTLQRSAWTDASVLGAPIGVDQNNILQQHEVSTFADGAPLLATVTSGLFSMAEGSSLTFIERVIMDFVTYVPSGISPRPLAKVSVTVTVVDPLDNSSNDYGPYIYTSKQFLQDQPPLERQVWLVRARGRMVQITISSVSPTYFWRLGNIRYNSAPSGSR